jgi:hypothetical protein
MSCVCGSPHHPVYQPGSCQCCGSNSMCPKLKASGTQCCMCSHPQFNKCLNSKTCRACISNRRCNNEFFEESDNFGDYYFRLFPASGEISEDLFLITSKAYWDATGEVYYVSDTQNELAIEYLMGDKFSCGDDGGFVYDEGTSAQGRAELLKLGVIENNSINYYCCGKL